MRVVACLLTSFKGLFLHSVFLQRRELLSVYPIAPPLAFGIGLRANRSEVFYLHKTAVYSPSLGRGLGVGKSQHSVCVKYGDFCFLPYCCHSMFYHNVLRANRSTSYRRFAGGAGGSLTRGVCAGAERAARTFFVRTARRFVLLLLIAMHFGSLPW